MLARFTIYRMKMFVRDKQALFWTIAFPLLFVFVFCGILGRSFDFKLNVALVAEESGPIVEQLIEGFQEGGMFNFSEDLNLEEAKQQVKKGKFDAVLIIPQGFSSFLFHWTEEA